MRRKMDYVLLAAIYIPAVIFMAAGVLQANIFASLTGLTLLTTCTLAGTILWFWMLYDWGTRQTITRNEKILWLIIFFTTFYVGGTIYYLLHGRNTT